MKIAKPALMFLLIGAFAIGAANSAEISRVSTSTAGLQAEGGNSFATTVNANGNLVAFASLANNLDPLDANMLVDVYLKNLSIGALTLVSKGPNGLGNGSSNLPQISADGSAIAFVSSASNLVDADTNAASDVFVYTVATGTIERISLTDASLQANGPSGAGSCGSNCFSISADGRFVAFESLASNLLALDGDATADIYRRDRQQNITILISQSSTGQLGMGPLGSNKPSISADGNAVLFESSRVLEPSDGNNTGDIYLRDVAAGTTRRINTSATGAFTVTGFSARPSISSNGLFAAFRSNSNDLVPSDLTPVSQRDVFVKDLTTGAIRRAEALGGGDPNETSNELALSGDGRILVFHSSASNLIAADANARQDVFQMIVATGAIERISVAAGSIETNNDSAFPDTNETASVSVFESIATNLVAGDSNARTDIFASRTSSCAPDAIFCSGFEQ